jgi:hypothetical protein
VVIVPRATDIPATVFPNEPGFLVDFLNTIDVEEGTDVLESDESWATWCDERGRPPGDAREARRVRDALRSIASGAGAELPAVPLSVRATSDGVVLVGENAAAAAVAVAATLTTRGTLGRVKLCPCADCGWAFYDSSRNASRTWCDMAVCGNRVKARTYRVKAVTAD